MEKIRSELGKQLVAWLSELKFFADTLVHVVVNTEQEIRVKLYTALNCYSIHAHSKTGYLACEVSARTPSPGEDWLRGNDLPDGDFSRELVNEILGSIVFYEAVEKETEPSQQ